MITENRIERAREFAIEKHREQMYGNKPYSFHLEGVAKYAKEMAKSATTNPYYREAIIIVAWLHDIVEDSKYTSVTIEEIYEMFGYQVGQAVESMSHDKSDTYAQYVEKVGKNDIATVVKLADLKFNTEQSRKEIKEKSELGSMYGGNPGYMKQRLAKYELAELYLNKVKMDF